MKAITAAAASAVAIVSVVAGVILVTPLVFAGRVLPGQSLAGQSLTGIRHDQLELVLARYEESLLNQTVTIELREKQASLPLRELGLRVDRAATREAIAQTTIASLAAGQWDVQPRLAIDDKALAMSVARHVPNTITPPQNATLSLTGATPLTLVPSRRGEQIDTRSLVADIVARLEKETPWSAPLVLRVSEQAPSVTDDEVASARQLGEEVLTEGINFAYDEETFHMAPNTLRRLLFFAPQPDPQNPANLILGVNLDQAGLNNYLANTLAPHINQEAVNARFELTSEGDTPPRVTQFALPQIGRTLDVNRTMGHAAASLAQHARTVPLAVDIVNPAVTEAADITELGLTARLAVGESDFAGSPKNRIHNITVGTARYHGLLIPPGEEFSFNEYLGPVDGQHGFLPELVIKNNVTTPEYGGGLCQVSTTVFRAALQAGLEITDRRNHAYAVRYYGTPGLDATIYPPSTDLKFTNNTPGYLLIQSRLDGTKLFMEFWGTNDGREVEVAGPVTYDRQPNGALKAYVKQQVTLAGNTLIDKTFYSRYQSPKLFPKVLAANGEAP